MVTHAPGITVGDSTGYAGWALCGQHIRSFMSGAKVKTGGEVTCRKCLGILNPGPVKRKRSKR